MFLIKKLIKRYSDVQNSATNEQINQAPVLPTARGLDVPPKPPTVKDTLPDPTRYLFTSGQTIETTSLNSSTEVIRNVS